MKQFQKIEVRKPKTNVFDLSHEKKLSCGFGELIPIYVQEVIPGDMFSVDTEIVARLAPLVFPLQHRINVYTHYFFVPNRILWSNWEDFITGGKDNTNASVHPYIELKSANAGWFWRGCLPDYMGVPTMDNVSMSQELQINALPFKAYQQIYNDYYRDPVLDTEVDIGVTTDGDNDALTGLVVLRTRCWEKDYFTSALPYPQQGSTTVEMPIEGEIVPDYIATPSSTGGAGAVTVDAGGNILVNGSAATIENLENPQTVDFTGIDIEDLRTAIKLQEWLEKNARGGWRYVEQMLSHFGVVSKDSRLQRAEYLGGGKQPVVISEVLATSDVGSYDVGQMAGHGISVGKSNGFKKYFTEHGWIIGIMSIMPRSAYYQGVPKHFIKNDKFDYYWPEFANLGEQPVLEYELYFNGTTAATGTFGYQERYSEYKFGIDTVHGDYRTTGYESYHMGRKFGSMPSLNGTFVHINKADMDRCFQVTTATVDKVYVQLYNKVKAVRPIPYISIPRF